MAVKPTMGPRLDIDSKVIVPHILARVKKSCSLACLLVEGFNLISLVKVARPASQHQFDSSSWPFFDLGTICSTSKFRLKIASGAPAVLATKSGPLYDKAITQGS